MNTGTRSEREGCVGGYEGQIGERALGARARVDDLRQPGLDYVQ